MIGDALLSSQSLLFSTRLTGCLLWPGAALARDEWVIVPTGDGLPQSANVIAALTATVGVCFWPDVRTHLN